MTKDSKNQTQDMGRDREAEDKIPLSFSLQWPIMKINQAITDVVEGYKRMFKIGPSDLKGLYLKRYETADRKGEIWKCIRWMEKVTSLDPQDPDGFYLLGIAYEKHKDAEAAIQAYTKATEIKPDHAKAYYRTGILHLLKRDFKNAVKLFEKAMKFEPHSAELNFRIGVAYDRLQDHEKALSHFSEAVKIQPDFLKVYKNMALTYDSMEKHKEALDCLKRALEIEEAAE